MLYAIVLVMALTPLLAALVMVLAAGLFVLLVSHKVSVNKLFFPALVMFAFNVAYYFLLNGFGAVGQLAFWNGEGRMFISLIILLIATSQTYTTSQLESAFNWMLRLYLLWLPLLFLIRIFRIGGGESSHHQLGVSAFSGFALILITAKRRNLWANATLLTVAFAATIFSGSRTAVLSALLMLAYTFWSRLKTLGKCAVIAVFCIIVVLLSGVKVEIGKRQYEFGGFQYIGAAIIYGLKNADSVTSAGEGIKSARVGGGDTNIVGRGVVWGKALAHFGDSPLIGIGPGRFDDGGSCSYKGALICVHDRATSNFNGTTAHNAVLHILAEQGLLGFALAAWLIISTLYITRSRVPQIEGLGFDRRTVTAFWLVLLFDSMFQHVLASPLYAATYFMPLISVACLQSSMATSVSRNQGKILKKSE